MGGIVSDLGKRGKRGKMDRNTGEPMGDTRLKGKCFEGLSARAILLRHLRGSVMAYESPVKADFVFL